MKVELIVLDKDRAKALLKGNEANRKVKKHLVNDLAMQMKKDL